MSFTNDIATLKVQVKKGTLFEYAMVLYLFLAESTYYERREKEIYIITYYSFWIAVYYVGG